jgi:hypothetical protein
MKRDAEKQVQLEKKIEVNLNLDDKISALKFMRTGSYLNFHKCLGHKYSALSGMKWIYCGYV